MAENDSSNFYKFTVYVAASFRFICFMMIQLSYAFSLYSSFLMFHDGWETPNEPLLYIAGIKSKSNLSMYLLAILQKAWMFFSAGSKIDETLQAMEHSKLARYKFKRCWCLKTKILTSDECI